MKKILTALVILAGIAWFSVLHAAALGHRYRQGRKTGIRKTGDT